MPAFAGATRAVAQFLAEATGNGTFTAAYDTPLPGGLMRLTLVTESVKGTEQFIDTVLCISNVAVCISSFPYCKRIYRIIKIVHYHFIDDGDHLSLVGLGYPEGIFLFLFLCHRRILRQLRLSLQQL